MAKPKVHIGATVILWFFVMFLEILLGIPITIYGEIRNLGILFVFGVLIDSDHIDYKDPVGWVIKFVKHEKVALPKGSKLWLHTFKALAAVVIVSILSSIYFPALLPSTSYFFLPILAFTVHMLMDGANRANNKPWQSGAYLPWIIHTQWPKRLTYFYDEGKEEETK